jgi:hypothetical protein
VNPFTHFAAVDWSGAAGPRQKGIAVAICEIGKAAPKLVRADHVWSREDVLAWLLSEMPANTLIGFDLSTSLAFADHGAFFPHWQASPPDVRSLWAMVDNLCGDEPNLGANRFVDHDQASAYFRRHGGRTGTHFGSGGGRLRIVEAASRDQGIANPYSNFNLVGAAQVGKSSLTGMRMLHRLAGEIPVWPFDPLPQSGSLIVEIYTSIAAVHAGLPKGRAKIRDAETLDTALKQLGSDLHAPLARYDDHATDAILTAAWLRQVHRDAALWNPAQMTDSIAQTEGWTFGVR